MQRTTPITTLALSALTLLLMFALVPSAAAMPEVTVQGVVWSDGNCDGIRQQGEAPYANQTVWLFAAGADAQINTADDQVIQTWTTGEAGMYRFDTGIAELDYALLILPIARPAGLVPGPLNAGSDRAVDNDMRTDRWATNGFRMSATQTVTGIDVGLCRNPNTVFVPTVLR